MLRSVAGPRAVKKAALRLKLGRPGGSMADDVLDLPSYTQLYRHSHAHTVLDCEQVGTGGASLIRFQCDAGRYACEASSDYALTMVQSGELGVGPAAEMGRSHARMGPGQCVLSPPFTATNHTV